MRENRGRQAARSGAAAGVKPGGRWTARAAVAAVAIIGVSSVQVVAAVAATPAVVVAAPPQAGIGLASRGPAPPGSPVARPAGLQADAQWILAAQLPNGAIASHADRTFVNPYLGGYAALGLATATRASGDPTYAGAAWRWAEWYGAAMDANGYVTDYQVTSSGLASTGNFDSTDAYSGMFLVAADATNTVAPDAARLRALAPKIALAVQAIRSTQRADGLTGAKPDWMVAYLMNEAEAYGGLRAASHLARALGDSGLARSADAAADTMAAGVARLWNPATGALDWAVHPDGAHVATNWAQLYPDALSQLWAVQFGLLHGPHATTVLQQFARTHPAAADPTATDLVDGTTKPGGYWPGAGLALRAVDLSAPARFLAGTRAAATASNRAWPYSVQTAAESIELAALSR